MRDLSFFSFNLSAVGFNVLSAAENLCKVNNYFPQMIVYEKTMPMNSHIGIVLLYSLFYIIRYEENQSSHRRIWQYR